MSKRQAEPGDKSSRPPAAPASLAEGPRGTTGTQHELRVEHTAAGSRPPQFGACVVWAPAQARQGVELAAEEMVLTYSRHSGPLVWLSHGRCQVGSPEVTHGRPPNQAHDDGMARYG